MNTTDTTWKKCTICKKSISFGARYYVCNVSTCNGERTGYVFCSVPCFDAHLPGARHRDAGAIEKMAPKSADAPSRILVRPPLSGPAVVSANKSQTPQEVLIIASRLKEYIQARSEFNTSASVMDVLSDHVRILCDRAIDQARAEGRKTVLDRDFDFLKKG
ncbi:hypothetical protein CIK05_03030 [Bdellovibrio sp. qaytius]|nr:hypothetical protein CIK05_03030 [Bdellovibrio sp. qaytius]